jgi:hypothetical protein
MSEKSGQRAWGRVVFPSLELRPSESGADRQGRVRPYHSFQSPPFHASVEILEHACQNTFEFNTPSRVFRGKNCDSHACSHKSFNS